MLRKFFATGSFLFATISSIAQENTVAVTTSTVLTSEEKKAADAPPEKKPALTISGSADVYYKYDFKKQAGNNKTSFTNSQNAFSLGMASVKLEHTGSKVGAVLDLGFGTRASEFSYNETGILSAVHVSQSPYADLRRDDDRAEQTRPENHPCHGRGNSAAVLP